MGGFRIFPLHFWNCSGAFQGCGWHWKLKIGSLWNKSQQMCCALSHLFHDSALLSHSFVIFECKIIHSHTKKPKNVEYFWRNTKKNQIRFGKNKTKFEKKSQTNIYYFLTHKIKRLHSLYTSVTISLVLWTNNKSKSHYSSKNNGKYKWTSEKSDRSEKSDVMGKQNFFSLKCFFQVSLCLWSDSQNLCILFQACVVIRGNSCWMLLIDSTWTVWALISSTAQVDYNL